MKLRILNESRLSDEEILRAVRETLADLLPVESFEYHDRNTLRSIHGDYESAYYTYIIHDAPPIEPDPFGDVSDVYRPVDNPIRERLQELSRPYGNIEDRFYVHYVEPGEYSHTGFGDIPKHKHLVVIERYEPK